MSDGITARNWANRTKDAAAAVPLTTEKKDRGVRKEGVFEGAGLEYYKTGSLGATLRYTVEGHKYPLRERIVLRKPDAEGNMAATQYGESSLKRRLQAFGITSDELATFAAPKTAKDTTAEAFFAKAAGASVAVYVKERTYMGKIMHDVGSVYPKDKE